ncbi:MAG: hypothetical protein ABII27_04265 [bacterium]
MNKISVLLIINLASMHISAYCSHLAPPGTTSMPPNAQIADDLSAKEIWSYIAKVYKAIYVFADPANLDSELAKGSYKTFQMYLDKIIKYFRTFPFETKKHNDIILSGYKVMLYPFITPHHQGFTLPRLFSCFETVKEDLLMQNYPLSDNFLKLEALIKYSYYYALTPEQKKTPGIEIESAVYSAIKLLIFADENKKAANLYSAATRDSVFSKTMSVGEKENLQNIILKAT